MRKIAFYFYHTTFIGVAGAYGLFKKIFNKP
jgi:hypothetical protein